MKTKHLKRSSCHSCTILVENDAYLKDDVGAIRDVDNAFEQIPLPIQNSFFEDVFGGVGDGQNDDERDDHGECFEGEQLTVRGQI